MYLKKLEIKGFKSFPDKTEILFPKGLISVVGPNGSGKSNILDAIRWVLGEQSMKSLRGDKLEDVIFSGTEKRKEMTHCEVSLLIDNSDKKLDLDYAEVDIKRKAFKSGESQFFINNKQCRLKDIKELLLDTGIGREGYSIISQGKIDELVEGSTFHRRKVIEEAAGITKYRYRKEESQKKLENTKENLERINDVYVEIEKQVKPLEEQKIKAEKYLALREQLIHSDVNRLLKEFQTAENSRNTIESALEKMDQSISELTNQQESLESEKINIKKQTAELVEVIGSKKESLSAFEEDIHRTAREIAVIEERRENISSSSERLDKSIDKMTAEIREREKQASEKEEAMNQRRKELSAIEEKYLQKCSDYESAKKQLKELEEKLEQNKALLLKQMNEQSAMQSKSELLSSGIQATEENIATVTGELNLFTEEQEDILRSLRLAEEEQQSIQTKLAENRREIESLQTDIDALELEQKKRQTEIQLLETGERDLSSKTALLKKMDQDMEGISKGAKELIKSSALPGILDVVANVLSVKSGYEKAIEAALGANLQNLIVENAESAKVAIQYLKDKRLGRVTFLPLDTIKGKTMEYNDRGLPAVKSVEYPLKMKGIIEYLLGRIVIVDTMDDAIQISKKYNYQFKIVTLDGEIFNAGGSITGGSIFSTSSIFTRRKTIDDYEKRIQGIKEEKEHQHRELQIKIKKQKADRGRLEELIRIKTELGEALHQAKSQAGRHTIESQHKKELMQKALRQLESLELQKQRDSEAISSYQTKIAEYEQQLTALKEEARRMIESKEQDLSSTEAKNSEIKEYEIEKTKLTQILYAMDNERKVLTQSLTTMKKERGEILKEKEENEQTGITLTEKAAALNRDIRQWTDARDKLISSVSAIENQQSPLLERLEAIEQLSRSLEKKVVEETSRKIKIESDRGKYEYQQQIITEKLAEDYQMDLPSAYEILDSSADTTKKHIEELRANIAAIGNVNLDSIEEYRKVSERYLLYREQKTDLENSIQKIEDIIKTLEKSMITEFDKSFQEINDKFKEVFKILFGGGHGELILSDSTDLLGSDIDINVQPPGKKLKSISVLSGGEKALSAIAILFSILMRKPVPFCILDEIDAPLDDANIFRFVSLLDGLSLDTQFLTITHRRGTMESSDYIYGVTMQENGISKIVSLKLEEAEHYIEN